MAVGAKQGVGEGPLRAVQLTRHHYPRQIFQIHLMHDAGIGRHHFEVAKGLLAPAQEAVAFGIAFKFDAAVGIQRIGAGEHVHLHRMVDHQFRRNLRVDLLGPAAQLHHRIPHCCQIHHAGHTGEILQDHAGRHKGDFGRRFSGGVPLCQRFDMRRQHADAVFMP